MSDVKDQETLTVSTGTATLNSSKYQPSNDRPMVSAQFFVNSGAVRWFADGTAPSATSGVRAVGPGATFRLEGTANLVNFKATRESNSDAEVVVLYERGASGVF